MKNFLKKVNAYISMNRPYCATSSEWNKWRKEAKKHKIRWFIFETFPLWFKITFIWPIEKIRDWFHYKIHDYRKIKITSLSPGYYDKDTLMLHGMFQLLVDFIEIEKAWKQYWWSEYDKQNFWQRFIFKFKKFRNKKYGLKYLDWEISLADPTSLSFEDYYKDPNFLKEYESFENYKASDIFKQSQSYYAQEQKALYLWWTEEFPNRKDPLDVKGDLGYSWNEYSEMMRRKYPDDDYFFSTIFANEEERLICESARKASDNIETAYKKQEDEMFTRLINIRTSLWD